jgi:hypothetical protein
MGTATSLVMGYKAILYGPIIARNNLKVQENIAQCRDPGPVNVQQKLEPPQNHTVVFIPGPYSCQYDNFILPRCIVLRTRLY